MNVVNKIDNIGFIEVTDERIKNVSKNMEWNYCEFCVTHRCNFSCEYCNKFTGELAKELTADEIDRIVCKLSLPNNTRFKIPLENHLRYIHFTGGEPTVRKDIVRIVRNARRNKCRVGMSTNGSADLYTYKNLVDCGVELMSISLDAKSEDLNSKMSGVNNVFNTVVNNIRELSKITNVTVGTVINDNNVNDIEKIITFISELGVSDIRISSATQYNKMLDINLSDDILEKHPILNYRVNNFKKKRNMRGVCGADCKHCWMALDDISVVGNYHFPCMVYAREKGKYIGRISVDDHFDNKIKEERLEWIKNHDCTQDPICQKYCMDFKVDYNNKFNKINSNIKELLR